MLKRKNVFISMLCAICLLSGSLAALFSGLAAGEQPDSPKQVLNPGLIDRAVPSGTQSYSKYAELHGDVNFLSNTANPGNAHGWYITTGEVPHGGANPDQGACNRSVKTVAGAESPWQYYVNGESDASLVYLVQPESYISMYIFLNLGLTGKGIYDGLNGMRFYSSADKANWEELTSGIVDIASGHTWMDSPLYFINQVAASNAPMGSEWCQVMKFAQVKANHTYLKIALPKKSVFFDSTVLATAQWHELGLRIAGVRASSTPITDYDTSQATLPGDTYYDYSEIRTLDNGKLTINGSEMLFNMTDSAEQVTMAKVESFLDKRYVKIEFYDSSDQKITDTNAQLATGDKVKVINDGNPNQTNWADGGSKTYNLTVKMLKDPSVKTTNSNIVIDQDNREIDVSYKTDNALTYTALKAALTLEYAEVKFFEADGTTEITDLAKRVKSGTKMQLIAKSCPGRDDGDVFRTFAITADIKAVTVTWPELITDPRLILLPGITDYMEYIADKDNETWRFTAFGEFSPVESIGSSVTDGSWLTDAKATLSNGFVSKEQFSYGGNATENSVADMVYKILPGSYISTTAIINTGIPASNIIEMFDSLKMYSSSDKINWEAVAVTHFTSKTRNEGHGAHSGMYDFLKTEIDNEGKGANLIGSDWFQETFVGKGKEGHTYFKIELPPAKLIRNFLCQHPFVDQTQQSLELDETLAYTWCGEHSRWDTGAPNHTAQGSTLSRAVADESMIWYPAFRVAAVKASTASITAQSNGDPDADYYYDLSQGVSSDNFALTLSDDTASVRYTESAPPTLNRLLSLIKTVLAEVKFYDGAGNEITDLSKTAENNMKIKIIAKGNAYELFANGTVLGEYTIDLIQLTESDIPTFESNSGKVSVDHGAKQITVTYLTSESFSYRNLLESLDPQNAALAVYDTLGNLVSDEDLDNEIDENHVLYLLTKNVPRTSDGLHVGTYSLKVILETKELKITSKDESKVVVDMDARTVTIYGKLSIDELLDNLIVENCELSFFDEELNDITDYSTVLSSGMYMDAISEEVLISFEIIVEDVPVNPDTGDAAVGIMIILLASTLLAVLVLFSYKKQRV